MTAAMENNWLPMAMENNWLPIMNVISLDSHAMNRSKTS